VQGNVGALEHGQQLVLVGVQPLQEPIEQHIAGAAREDAIETPPEFGFAPRCGVAAIGFLLFPVGRKCSLLASSRSS